MPIFKRTLNLLTMKRSLRLLVLAALLLLPGLLMAQFTVSAELRPRAEMDNGAIKPIQDTMSTRYFVTQRTRLKFDFKKEKYQLRLTIQDVRFWGSGDIYSSTGVWGTTAGLDIQEAWLRLKLCEYSNLTIGRQLLKLDDQRLIAGRNWNQWGLAYDAIRYNMIRNEWNLNLVVSYNTNAMLENGKYSVESDLFDHRNLMKTFNYIHVNKTFNENLTLSLMAIGAGYQSSKSASVIYMMGTYGAWLKYKTGIFDISTDLYYQSGKAQSGKDVSAYMATLHPGVTFSKIRIGLGGDYISGDNVENDDFGEKEKTFNKMYGAVFKYYGFMNYFTYMKKTTANAGLVNIYPNIKVPIKGKHIIFAQYVYFMAANPVYAGDENTDKNLGGEIDLMYTYKIMKELTLQAGFSYFMMTETLEKMRGVYGTEYQSPYWAWVMVTFTPELFSTK